MIIIGNGFANVGEGSFLPFSKLNSPEGLETYDQLQMSYIDDGGVTQLRIFEFDESDGWLDCEEDYEPCGDTKGLELGQAAWFLPSGSPKSITTSGEVKRSSHIHTFTETMKLVSSAFPAGFCPNSSNVSWGFESYDQIQTFYTDDLGVTQLRIYEYDESDGWLDCEDDYRILEPDEALVGPGIGFWILISNAESTFTETSPIGTTK